jgi:hypothetical protein
MLCTNGLNNISLTRHKLFINISEPFCKTDVKLGEIVPEDIYKRLKETGTVLRGVNDDMAG